MQTTDKAAHSSLLLHFSDLSNSSFDPVNVAGELLAAGIIGDETLFKVRQETVNPANRRMDIVQAVMANGKEGVFQTFLQVLMKGQQNSFVCDKLIATYRSQGGVWVEVNKPGPSSPMQQPVNKPALKKLDFHNVVKQLSGFDPTFWRDLGTNLQLPHHKLNAIAAGIAGKPRGQNEALTSVVDFWLKNDLQASWEKLATAVEMCEDATRARNIREDVGLIPPTAGLHHLEPLPSSFPAATATTVPAASKTSPPSLPPAATITEPAASRPSPSSTPPPPAVTGKLAEKPALDDLQLIETENEDYSIPDVVGTSYGRFASYLLQDKDGRIVQELEEKHGKKEGDIVFDVLHQWIQGKGRECTWKNLLSALKACGRKKESDKIKDFLMQS